MSFRRFLLLKSLLLLFWVNSIVCQTPACNNCCHNYEEINEPRRSKKSVWQPGETPLCDRSISSGWYRFTSFNGTKIPEGVVPEYRCGTHSPIWLNDRHPTKAEGNVACKACINSFGLNAGCFRSFNINITNCGNYFVYYLRPLGFCAVAYCAGKKMLMTICR